MNYLAHYTKFEFFTNMLKGNVNSSEERHLTFWASSAYDMDDQTEMNYGYPLIQYILREYEKNPNLTKEQRLTELFNALSEIITRPSEKHFLPKTQTPFVVSFTQAFENNYMWENFGDKGKGVCLYFDADKIDDLSRKGNGSYFSNVVYIDEKECDYEVLLPLVNIIIRKAIECHFLVPHLENKSDIPLFKKVYLNSMCPVISAFLKDGQFSREMETRLIFIRDESTSMCREKENGKRVNYMKIEIPLNFLVGITVGPNLEKTNELEEICREKNIKIIDKSEILLI